MGNTKGTKAEETAAAILTKLGYSIIERNYTLALGEIDIIAHKEGIIHFIEVKSAFGTYNPAENFHKTKLKRMMKAVRVYCHTRGVKEEGIQIDLVLLNMRDRVFKLINHANVYFD